MERDFESEFKELKQSEIPDLWNRIEAALPEKKATATSPVEEATAVSPMGRTIATSPTDKITAVSPAEKATAMSLTEKATPGIPGKRKQYAPKKKASWGNWGILAAACLCVMVIFPAVMMGLTSGTKSGGSDMMSSADTDKAEMEDASADVWEAADADEATGSEEAAVGSEDASPDTGSVYPVDETDGVDETDEADEKTDNGLDGSGNFDKAPVLVDGQILEDVVVKILSADDIEGDGIYKASVEQEDIGGVLGRETQIELICNEESQYAFPRGARESLALKKGESYVVTLQYEESYIMEEDANGVEDEQREGVLMFFVLDAALFD